MANKDGNALRLELPQILSSVTEKQRHYCVREFHAIAYKQLTVFNLGSFRTALEKGYDPECMTHTAIGPGKDQRIQVSTDTGAFRLVYADVIRALAILQVIYVHCSVPFIANMSNKESWWAAFIPEILGRASVPLFLILSGIFLLKKEIDKRPFSFMMERLKRLVVPLAIWSGFYYWWAGAFLHNPYPHQNLLAVMQYPIYYHLGYLYFLTGICFAAPMLKTFTKAASRTDYVYFAALWLAACCVMPITFRCTGYSLHLLLPFIMGLSGYFVLGYAMKDVTLDRRGVPATVLALLTTVVLGGLLTYEATRSNNGFFDAFYLESSSPFIIVYSFATFLLVKSVDFAAITKKHHWLEKVAKSISDASFTMYLIHPAIIDICQRYKLDHIVSGRNFITTSVNIFLAFCIVSLTAWLFSKSARVLRLPQWLVP